jgi:hypothetical protein
LKKKGNIPFPAQILQSKYAKRRISEMEPPTSPRPNNRLSMSKNAASFYFIYLFFHYVVSYALLVSFGALQNN